MIRLPTAIDPWRRPIRYVYSPRYDAMQSYFERAGDSGLVMMTSTAAIQVNLDAGNDPADVGRRWLLAHAIGPTLVAAFANSPIHRGRITGWKSTRQRVWGALDAARTRPVIDRHTAAADPVTSWAEYALNAPVMMLRRPGRWLPAPGFTFRDWVNGLTAFGRPSEDDLAYHLTTLFPPVRPRGWYEVRYLDAQPLELWPVPIAVVTALLEDPEAQESALEATEPVRDSWGDAAQFGLTSPPLARAAMHCFEAAIAALPRLSVEPSLVALVEWFAEHYVARHRSPADSQIEPDDAGYPHAGGEKVHR
jgi:glutamate--cysteine ligase